MEWELGRQAETLPSHTCSLSLSVGHHAAPGRPVLEIQETLKSREEARPTPSP